MMESLCCAIGKRSFKELFNQSKFNNKKLRVPNFCIFEKVYSTYLYCTIY